MADNASKGFAEFVYNMTKDVKPEEVSELIESKELDNDDKLAIIVCYADTHTGFLKVSEDLRCLKTMNLNVCI